MLRTTLPIVITLAGPLAMGAGSGAWPWRVVEPAGASTEAKDELGWIKGLAGRNLARIVFSDLALQESPVADDHRLASQVLSVAYELWPTDQILRWRLGAASAADDRAEGIELCRMLLRTDPDNTVVQYHLITLLLDETHTAEGKLARLRRMIGPEGARLDASIRSRLCMDAAALCQQLGDESGFVEYVKQGATLDPSNRDAAAAAAAYFAERVDDPIGRLELLANLLLSEPADPETQIAIGRELSAVGAFGEALRFQENVVRMVETAQVGVPPLLARERLYSRWGALGPKVVVDELNSQVMAYRDRAARQKEEMEKELIPAAEIPNPEDVRLEVLTERLRLIGAVAAGDLVTAQSSAKDLRATIASRVVELSDPRRRPEEIDDAKAAEITRQMLVGTVTLLSWSGVYQPPAPSAAPGAAGGGARSSSPFGGGTSGGGTSGGGSSGGGSSGGGSSGGGAGEERASGEPAAFDSDALMGELEELKAAHGIDENDLDFRTARGWVLVRAGKFDEARAILEAVGDQRVEAQLGLAQLHQLKGENEQAIESYRQVWQGVPQSLEAMFSYSMLRQLLGREDLDPQLVRRAKGFADGIPAWIDKLGEGGHRFMSLEADVSPSSVTALEETNIRLRLRNVSPVPLGLGADRTLNSQILVGSGMEIGMANVRAYLTPEATSLARRLRLMPNESVTVDYWPDAGSAGWVIDECCDRLVRQRWRAVQGFTRSEAGVISAGALCLSRETGSQVRLAVPQAGLTNAELATRLATGDVKEVGAVASVIRARLLNPLPGAAGEPLVVGDAEKAAFAAAAAGRYASLPAAGRMALLVLLPQAAIVEAMRPLDDIAKAETDASVAVVVLITRVTEASDPFLAACSASADARLGKVAAILSSRLAAGGEGYASRGGPDVFGIIMDSIAEQRGAGAGGAAPGGAGR